MNWKKLILPPVAIYGVIFLFISVLIGAKIDQHASWVWIVSLIITIVGLYLAVNFAKPKSWREGLTYGLVWLVIFFILDLILTVPFTGWGYFNSWKAYLSYALILILPVILSSKE